MHKACSQCGVLKAADHFSPLKRARDGLHSWCKNCLAAWRRVDRANNVERYREIERRRHAKDGEKRREANRRIWAERGESYREKAKPRIEGRRSVYNTNRRQRIASDTEYKQEIRERQRELVARNGHQYREARRRKWAEATPAQRLRSYFGAAIYHALKGTGKGGKSWQQLVGYKTPDLARHLERQFLPGMTWDNYGEWHVDHIVPVASFNFSSPDDPDFRACWALTNLRPLWSGDNIRKSDNRLHLL